LIRCNFITAQRSDVENDVASFFDRGDDTPQYGSVSQPHEATAKMKYTPCVVSKMMRFKNETEVAAIFSKMSQNQQKTQKMMP